MNEYNPSRDCWRCKVPFRKSPGMARCDCSEIELTCSKPSDYLLDLAILRTNRYHKEQVRHSLAYELGKVCAETVWNNLPDLAAVIRQVL